MSSRTNSKPANRCPSRENISTKHLAQIGALTIVCTGVGWLLSPTAQPITAPQTEKPSVTSIQDDALLLPNTIDETTAIRWTTFDLVARLVSTESDAERNRAEKQLLSMLEADPYETMNRLGQIPEAHNGSHVLPTLLMDFLPSMEIAQAGALIERLKANPDLYSTVIDYWAENAIRHDSSNDQAFYNWVVQKADDPLAANGLANAMGYIMHRDGKQIETLNEAWDLTLSLPDGAVRRKILESTLDQFLDKENIGKVESLIEELPSHPEHDEVFARYAETMSDYELERPMQYLNSIQNQGVWDRVFYTIVGKWAERDIASLGNWLVNNHQAFSDDELDHVNRILADHQIEPLIEIDYVDE
ncbi:MAG: hypothetical protein AAFX93_00515 [Verrucomicrobiota bacterium]